jgi:hypothetical protein
MGKPKGSYEGFGIANGVYLSSRGCQADETPIQLISCIGFYQTSIASRALDGLSDPETKQGVIDELLRYLDTDTTW